jgi:two-component sensor histidine kinase
MPSEPKSGLGLKLIDLLSRQIESKAEWADGAGARLILRLPIKVA